MGGSLLSDAAGSARETGRQAAEPTGLSLYAASMRNLLPRLISSAAIASVAGCFLGWGWARVWSCAVWANLWLSTVAMAAAARQKTTRWARPLGWAVTANSILGGSIQAFMVTCLWAHGGDVPRTFALITIFIGSAYVLLQYYADLTLFRLLLACSLHFLLHGSRRCNCISATHFHRQFNRPGKIFA